VSDDGSVPADDTTPAGDAPATDTTTGDIVVN
jgi:hypothetical protein